MSIQEIINVLLIEDNLDDARLLEIMLDEVQPNPVNLHHATSLALAKDLLKFNSIDLILLDLSLPDGHGLDSIETIQRIDSSLPIIILTGLNDQDFAIKTVHHGAQDYLVKGQEDGRLTLRAINYAIERKQIEQKLTLLAHFDSLTGLANREHFNNTLSHILKLAKRNKQTFALLFLDLDHFKEINDTLGHLIGDQLLISVAGRLKSCVRFSDFVARLGGDEFVIILDAILSTQDIMGVSEKILSALSDPFKFENREIFISSSIGITLYPDDAENTNDLLKYADVAMYHAKDKGRNNYQFYTPKLNIEVLQAMEIKNELRGAIRRNEILLFYQPKINLSNNKIIGAEALLRWRHPTRGMISPDNFIPIAEKYELIISIGKWVISEALKQTKKWQENFHHNFSMAINLSVKQFQKGDLIDYIDTELNKFTLDPSTIEFEITESLLMQKSPQAQEVLRELNNKGFKISIDDFGTGYSSLSYLKRFTINELKIDRSFIKNVISNRNDAEIVKAIIAMAHALKLKVVAEGVENENQKTLLQQLDCDQIQGFLISKPVPAIDFENLLRQAHE